MRVGYRHSAGAVEGSPESGLGVDEPVDLLRPCGDVIYGALERQTGPLAAHIFEVHAGRDYVAWGLEAGPQGGGPIGVTTETDPVLFYVLRTSEAPTC